jgi:hypothetical protein
MLAFTHIAKAAECSGTGVSQCNQSKTQSVCGTTFRKTSPQLQCAWDGSTCRANGATCGCSKDTDCTYNGGKCNTSNGTCSYGNQYNAE